MKYQIPLLIVIVLSSIFVNGCSGKVNNSVTFNNLSQGTILINFRGNAIEVPANGSSSVQDIPKGTYNYSSSIISAPEGTITKALQGVSAGTINITAGTKVLIAYTSTLTSGAYIVIVTISSSDDLSTPTSP
jgi:hypothetical protein